MITNEFGILMRHIQKSDVNVIEEESMANKQTYLVMKMAI